MRDFGLFVLRLTVGGLLAGHGAQKLFGAFGGQGISGTGGFFESALGLRPGERWAILAGGGEFGGGMLTALGFLHPIGPLTTLAPMIVAWARVHAGKPIWASEGGAELPLLNMATAAALICTGPGKWSVDKLSGVRPHPALTTLAALGLAIGSYIAISQPPQLAETASQQTDPAAAT
ncbi:MAG: DoxX family protein [Chloroflexota bacterium]|nr:DoxX family protein [Chloroflexota bacterium]